MSKLHTIRALHHVRLHHDWVFTTGILLPNHQQVSVADQTYTFPTPAYAEFWIKSQQGITEQQLFKGFANMGRDLYDDPLGLNLWTFWSDDLTSPPVTWEDLTNPAAHDFARLQWHTFWEWDGKQLNGPRKQGFRPPVPMMVPLVELLLTSEPLTQSLGSSLYHYFYNHPHENAENIFGYMAILLTMLQSIGIGTLDLMPEKVVSHV